MSEIKPSRWRPIAAIALLIAVAVGWLLLARTKPEAEPDNRVAPAAPPESAKPAAPVRPLPAPPPLDRAALIAAASRAASAFALGGPAPDENLALAGRRFMLALPFGCGGPAPSADELGAFGWYYDEEQGTLRARATPQIWTEAPWAAALAGDRAIEAIEGFWIRRPWIREASCPAGGTDMPAAAAPGAETVGIARLFEPESRRSTRRNGEPYLLTKKMGKEEAPGTGGLRLIVEGRLAADPARQPVACWSPGPEQRPVCILIARIERVAITRADGTTTLAEWAD